MSYSIPLKSFLAALVVLVVITALFPPGNVALGLLCGVTAALIIAWASARRKSPSAATSMAETRRDVHPERQRLEAILSIASEGLIAVDLDQRMTVLNDAAQKFLGLEKSACLGKRLDEVFQSSKLRELAEVALSGRERSDGEVTYGTKLLKVHAAPLDGASGAVLSLHNLTEIRRLESMRTDFVANVSHELKTPLTSIRAYVDTLLDGGLDDPSNRTRFVEKIDTHVNRLAVLITDLLSLSRIESGQAITQHTHLNILEPLNEAVSRLGPNAENRNIELRVRVPSQPCDVLGDREALQQVFDNLIDNAIKYTEPGDVVDIGAEPVGGHIRVRVSDTGMGIPKEDLPRVFERFYRVDKARSRELGGTGLGLSIVKHYVQALGGEVQVDSEVGKGTTFTVLLPRI